MANGRGNGDGPDLAIMTQANALLQERMRINSQILEQEQTLATTANERRSTMGMIVETAQSELMAVTENLRLATDTDEALAKKIAALEELNGEWQNLTDTQKAELEYAKEIQALRAKDPQAAQQMVQALKQQHALKQQQVKDAKAERQLVDETARGLGKSLANMMGMKKQQDGLLKSFIKSKHKIDFMKSAMKGFAEQINLASLGTKIMQSGFQMLTMVAAKLFGGGGGGKNLSEFVKKTGHASGNMHRLAKQAARLGKKLKVGFEEGAEAVSSLMAGMSGFMEMSQRTQKSLAFHTLKMSAFNVSAEDTAKILSSMTDNIGMTTKEAMNAQMKFFNAATALAVPVEQMMGDFQSFMEDVPGLGKKATSAFLGMASAAKKIGVEMKTITDFGKAFETYEDAMDKTAQLNAMMGKNALDGYSIMEKSINEGPAAALKEMNKQLSTAGINMNEMSRAEKLEAADILGMSVSDMEKMMKGEKTVSDMEKAMGQVDKLTGSVNNFNKALKKTKPPGGGGGQDFLTLVLKEYNALTKGALFKNVREMRRWLKKTRKEAARFVAEWIQKIEHWFIEAAQSFKKWLMPVLEWWNEWMFDSWAVDTKKIGGGIDWITNAAKNMGPILVPILVIVAGKLTKIVGLIGSVVIGLGKMVVSGGAGLGGLAGRFGALNAAMQGPGTMMGKLKDGMSGFFGVGQKGLSVRANAAQDVVIVQDLTGGAGAAEGAVGGAAGGAGAAGAPTYTGNWFGRMRAADTAGSARASDAMKRAWSGRHVRRDALGRFAAGGRRGKVSGFFHGIKDAASKGLKAYGAGAAAGADDYVKAATKVPEVANALRGVDAVTDATQAAAAGLQTTSKVTQGLHMLGKGIPILGSLIGIVVGGMKIMEGDIGRGAYDIATGLALFIPVVGPVVSGLMAVGGMAYDFGQELVRARDISVSTTDIYKNMSDEGKRVVKNYEDMNAAITNIPQRIAEKFGVTTSKKTASGRVEAAQLAKEEALAAMRGGRHTFKYDARQVTKDLMGGGDRFAKFNIGDFQAADVSPMHGGGKTYKGGVLPEGAVMVGTSGNRRTLSDAERADIAAQKGIENANLRIMHAERDTRKMVKEAIAIYNETAQGLADPITDANATMEDVLKKMPELAAEAGKHGKAALDSQKHAVIEWQNTIRETNKDYEDMDGWFGLDVEARRAADEIMHHMGMASLGLAKRQGMAASLIAQLKTKRGEVEAKQLLEERKAELSLEEFEFYLGWAGQGTGEMVLIGEMLEGKKRFGEKLSASDEKMLEMFTKQKEAWEGEQVALDRLMRDPTFGTEFFDASGKLTKAGEKLQKSIAQIQYGGGGQGVLEALGGGAKKLLLGHGEESMAFWKSFVGEDVDRINELRAKLEDVKNSGDEAFTNVFGEVFGEIASAKNLAKAEAAKITPKEQAKTLAEKGFKVSKRDINNIKMYQVLLEKFAETLKESEVESRFTPFIENMTTLNNLFRDEQSKAGIGRAADFFFQVKGITAKHAANVAAVTEKTSTQVDAIAEATQKWEELKKTIEETEATLAGQLFFKGGTINQNVKSETSVVLKVGGKTFGNAVLEGLSSVGKTTIE